ncbi:MAG TPA: bifunctional UDP-N-acetylglucosamine diphosphorylase/glucosamine-1-phosphate N-acetyltransferase GlmU [Vicinamibacterales bacterium]|nr:bifunctional UDP-N-acetylglucosamine diphosphorylase/glucosamine-1-phosphate N-acetyltransferase GlmU [Vicinamibacterales bacterium]
MAVHVVILAAGKGTRMKSRRPKVLHDLAGRPLIEHVLVAADHLRARSTTLVVGHGAEEVRAALTARPDLQYVTQSPQLGTGHALLQTEPVLKDQTGTVLLLYADVPLLQPGTLSRLIETHEAARATATVLTATLDDPYGYGRIVRDDQDRIVRIVEERDASSAERLVREVNSGLYALALGPLFDALHELATDNSQGEYYLTDLVAAYRRRQLPVETLRLDSPAELRGVNSRVDLADLTHVVRERKARAVMLAGVTLDDPDTTYIDDPVVIGADTTVGPGVSLQGATTIGRDCRIHPGARLSNAVLGDGVVVLDGSVIVDSTVAAGASIGPYAHLRPGSAVGDGARVGNFVELKKTTMGAGAKANHLAYLGDATIGDRANIGAGTITCNYDGERKHKTVIGDGAFIGSDSQLVAPVTVGRGAYVAAGSTITDDVPDGALGIARGRQTNKAGWAQARARRSEKS